MSSRELPLKMTLMRVSASAQVQMPPSSMLALLPDRMLLLTVSFPS